MGAVAGTRRTMKELVDGTIRVQIDIDPKDAEMFRRLLPHVDMPVALAPLVPGYELREKSDGSGFDELDFPTPTIGQIATFTINEQEAEELGGSTWTTLGPLCQSAIMLGKTETFQKWVDDQHPEWVGNVLPPPEERVARYIRATCLVDSRKQLDELEAARTAFRQMMAKYRRWVA